MITRPIEKQDLEKIQELMNNKVSLSSLKLSLKESIITSLIIDDQIQGFVMIRNIGGVNELTQWHLKPEHSIILKSMKRRLKGKIATHEKESNKERIIMLKENGFEQLRITQGIFPNENAVTLIQD